MIVLLLVAVPAIVIAAANLKGDGRFPVTEQAFQWRTQPTSTTSTQWEKLDLNGLHYSNGTTGHGQSILVVGRGGMSATVSADFKGAPVELRVVSNRNVLAPGKAEFRPSPGDSSTSFTFVRGPGATVQCRNVWVEWRSPSGETVTFTRGDLVVTYKPEPLKDSACA